jgi:hypothetical protein
MACLPVGGLDQRSWRVGHFRQLVSTFIGSP